MKKPLAIVLLSGALLAALAGGAAAGFWYARQSAPQSSDSPPSAATDAASTQPLAAVDTVPAAVGPIVQTLDAYGTVAGDPAKQQTLTAPYEGRISKMLVSTGIPVVAGQTVAQIEPSPDSLLIVRQAKITLDAATRDLQNAKERFAMKLATNQELQTSQSAFTDAKVKYDDLQNRGVGLPQTLKARAPGIVSKTDAVVGQIIPIGGPILEIDDATPSQVRLGIEAQDVQRLARDAAVDLTLVGAPDAAPVKGLIHLIAPRVNPDTRLVDVLVALPEGSQWLIGSSVEARVTVGSKDQALLVPRNAVLPADDGQRLFTASDGKAVTHTVTVGLQTDQQVEVLDAKPPVKAGDLVVITGNYELDDGMAVTTRPAP